MSIQTYVFNQTGCIPGIPGEWHAGQLVDVDLDTMTVIRVRLAGEPSQESSPVSSEETVRQIEEV